MTAVTIEEVSNTVEVVEEVIEITLTAAQGPPGPTGKSALAVAIAQGLLPEGTTDSEFAAWLSSSSEAAAASAATALALVSWTTVAEDHAATPPQKLLCDTSDGGFTVTLPADPDAGDEVRCADAAGTFDASPLIVDGNGKLIDVHDTLRLALRWADVAFRYTGAAWTF